MDASSPDSFVPYPMVEEAEATGQVAGVYAELLTTSPFVPSLFKSLALCPGYLVLAHEQAAPALRADSFTALAGQLATSVRDAAAPPADPVVRQALAGFLAPLSTVPNPMITVRWKRENGSRSSRAGTSVSTVVWRPCCSVVPDIGDLRVGPGGRDGAPVAGRGRGGVAHTGPGHGHRPRQPPQRQHRTTVSGGGVYCLRVRVGGGPVADRGNAGGLALREGRAC